MAEKTGSMPAFRTDHAEQKKSMPAFKTDQLSVGYKKKIIVSDISLEIMPGRILTLVGPNGCGKSTLMKTAVRQLESIEGVIYLSGKPSKEVKPDAFAKELGMVLTDRPKTELMTCRDMVATGRYPYTGRMGILSEKDWKEVDRAIALVHAEEVAGQDFMQVSDGQKQRILLARALCQETKILVLDEPTSYLDVHFKQDILTMIRKLAREKQLAVLMSLHEPDLVRFVSDTVACVSNGKIDRLGTPEEVFAGDYIEKLYMMEPGTFNPLLGTSSLRLTQGEPKVFVIGGGGKGIPVCNHLQRENIPFAAGILSRNDIEYFALKALTGDVISCEAFAEAGQEQIDAAKAMIDRCEYTICALSSFGQLNDYNRELRDYAARLGKLK